MYYVVSVFVMACLDWCIEKKKLLKIIYVVRKDFDFFFLLIWNSDIRLE